MKLAKGRASLLIDLGVLFLFTGVALFAYRHFIFSPGGRAGEQEWLFPLYSGQFFDWVGGSLSAWRTWEFGEYSVGTPALYLYIVFAFPALLGLSGAAIGKLVVVALMVGGGYEAYYLCRQLRIGATASVIAGLTTCFPLSTSTGLSPGSPTLASPSTPG